jgi:hypothetical protein
MHYCTCLFGGTYEPDADLSKPAIAKQVGQWEMGGKRSGCDGER